MKPKSIKNIRQEFRDKGIFYTPTALAEKLRSYVGAEPRTVYDPTCGAGNLLRVFPDNVEKHGQELDPDQLALASDIPNFHGYAGDTLMDDGFADQTFDCIVANPPFSVRWDPDVLKDDPRFTACPVMPPPSKADWAFMLHMLYHLSDDGVAAALAFPGILYRGQREGKVRQWFVENNYIDRIVNIPGNTFEDTSISTVIVVLRRRRETTDIIFEDGDRTKTVSRDEIAGNDYSLSISIYLPDETPHEEIDIDAVNKEVVDLTVSRIDKTFDMLLAVQEIAPTDDLHIMELYGGLRDVLRKHERAVWMAEFERKRDEQPAAD